MGKDEAKEIDINYLINKVLLIMIFLMPIVITIGSLDYTVAKIITLLSLGGILFLLYSIKSFKEHLTVDYKDIIIILFGAWISLSTICSSNIEKSLMGEANRYEGLLTYYIYIITYFCAKKIVKNDNIRSIFLTFQVLFIIEGLIGISQNYIHFADKRFLPIFDKGVCGTVGNVNFFGSLLCLGIPLFIGTYLFNNNKVSLVTSLLCFYCVLNCTTRSAWIAFIFCIILFIIYLIKTWKKEYLKRIIILISSFIVVFTYVAFIEENNFSNKINAVKKDVSTISESGIEKGLGSGRIGIWKVCIELVKMHPILGVGTDNVGEGIYANIKSDNPTYQYVAGYYVDKAHNEYLNIAVTVGIPGLVLYLIFGSMIIIPRLRNVFRNNHDFILFAMIIGYLVQAFFNISTIGVAILFWFVVGIFDNDNIRTKLLK